MSIFYFKCLSFSKALSDSINGGTVMFPFAYKRNLVVEDVIKTIVTTISKVNKLYLQSKRTTINSYTNLSALLQVHLVICDCVKDGNRKSSRQSWEVHKKTYMTRGRQRHELE